MYHEKKNKTGKNKTGKKKIGGARRTKKNYKKYQMHTIK